MEHSSKALLELEHSIQSPSTKESPLLVCKNNDLRELQRSKPKPPDGKPFVSPVGRSQVLGKVKDFLGVISEANKRLVDDAKDNAKDYDIEVLTGNESEYIEMDLMLGVADLHTPEAVAAAESAISGCQPLISLAANSSGSESEDSSHDGSDSESDDDYHDGRVTGSPPNLKRPKPSEDGSPSARECRSKKQPKIVELS